MTKPDAPERAYKIMIVDDEPVCRSVTEAVLQNANYETICMENAVKALKYLKEHDREIDIIIVDKVMPHMDGFEMVSEVRTNVKLRKIPIIMLSGSGGQKEVYDGIKKGVDMYLYKPIEESALLKAINITIANLEFKQSPVV